MSRKGPRRGLSDDDLSVWKKVATTITPLEVQPVVRAPDPGPLPQVLKPSIKIPLKKTETAVPKTSYDLAPTTVDRFSRATPQMDRKNLDRLKKGKLRPERRIDLHGMTAAAAHAALHQFLIGAHGSGIRVVLVITGKGRDDRGRAMGQGRGVLRSSLPHWLDQEPLRSMIVQTVPAADKDGGTGAFYVYLRRQRSRNER